MKEPSLSHLIYTSAAVGDFHGAALNAMLQRARTANATLSVSGMLLYTEGSFFQVLEGEQSTLEALFDKIAADVRHSQVTCIIREPIAQRAFNDWTMGFVEVDPQEAATIDGLSDFFDQGSSLTSLPDGRARKVLTAFAQGRWRARLSGSA